MRHAEPAQLVDKGEPRPVSPSISVVIVFLTGTQIAPLPAFRFLRLLRLGVLPSDPSITFTGFTEVIPSARVRFGSVQPGGERGRTCARLAGFPTWTLRPA